MYLSQYIVEGSRFEVLWSDSQKVTLHSGSWGWQDSSIPCYLKTKPTLAAAVEKAGILLGSSSSNRCVQQRGYETLHTCSCMQQTQSWALSEVSLICTLANSHAFECLIIHLKHFYNVTGRREQGIKICRRGRCTKKAVLISTYTERNASKLCCFILRKELHVWLCFVQSR